MQRSPLDALVTEKVLHHMMVSGGGDMLELLAEDKADHNFPMQNVCARVTPELAARLTEMCIMLDVSKRRFLEAAFIEALSKADSIIEGEGFFELMAERDAYHLAKTKDAA